MPRFDDPAWREATSTGKVFTDTNGYRWRQTGVNPDGSANLMPVHDSEPQTNASTDGKADE